jgi:hypothetical protein
LKSPFCRAGRCSVGTRCAIFVGKLQRRTRVSWTDAESEEVEESLHITYIYMFHHRHVEYVNAGRVVVGFLQFMRLREAGALTRSGSCGAAQMVRADADHSHVFDISESGINVLEEEREPIFRKWAPGSNKERTCINL